MGAGEDLLLCTLEGKGYRLRHLVAYEQTIESVQDGQAILKQTQSQ